MKRSAGRFPAVFLVLFIAGSTNLFSTPTESLVDRQRKRIGELAGRVTNESLPILWSKDGKTIAYAEEIEPGKRTWKELTLFTGAKRPLGKKPEGFVEGLEEPKGSPSRALISKAGAKSPDGRHEVEIRKNEIYLDGRRIADAPGEGLLWADRIIWSPDSTRFVVGKRSNHPARQIHFVRSSPEESLQPEHFTHSYPKPGDLLNIPHPVVFFVDGRNRIEVEEGLVENPFDLRKWGWRPDGQRFLFEFIERGFGSHRIIEIDTESREQRVLVDETDEKFVFVFGNGFRRDLGDGEEILWLSERDGWNHLYLVDGATGEVKRQLTRGSWVVRGVPAVHEAERWAILEISGYDPDQDPYHVHFAKVDLDGGGMTMLTEGDGTHRARWDPGMNSLAVTWSRVDHPPVHELRSLADGSRIATLAKAEGIQRLEEVGWQRPQRFVEKDRNDEYDIHGFLLRPRDFDPKKSYPVIEAIYAGPHGSFTPKDWRTYRGVLSEMADSGFLVVKLDGLGTNHRGRKFQQVAYQNLIDSGLPDRVKWIRALAGKVPQMDLDRVGIYGGSAGGQSTLAALLTQGDFYRAGAADCGCHDNRMDKIWWNEQWMDWPVGPAYEANSNLTHIGRLEGNLLLTVGELDRNVDPSSTYRVVDALVKADKDFEFYMIPGAGHGVGETPYLRRKRIEFFRRHLGGPK